MITIFPPYNGSGFPVREARDVEGTLRQVFEMTFDRSYIRVWWHDDGDLAPEAVLTLGLDRTDSRVGIAYQNDDQFVPVDITSNELEFSDGHSADYSFDALLPLDTVVDAVARFYELQGDLPDTFPWQESRRLNPLSFRVHERSCIPRLAIPSRSGVAPTLPEGIEVLTGHFGEDAA